jgi:hypothetical protein
MTGRKALVPAEETKMLQEATMPAAKPGVIDGDEPKVVRPFLWCSCRSVSGGHAHHNNENSDVDDRNPT